MTVCIAASKGARRGTLKSLRYVRWNPGKALKPRTSEDQWQPHPPPQQLPPPEEPEGDLEEPPAIAELKTDSCMVAFLLEHCGQEISCWRLMTIFSNWDLQSSQTYS
jgi:hypothetical protein